MSSLIMILIAITTYVFSNILGRSIYKLFCNRIKKRASAQK